MEAGELRRRAKQRQAALDKANKQRVVRSELKQRLKRRELDAIAVVAGDSEVESLLPRWRVGALIRAVPGIGDASMVEICEVGKFSPTMRVSALSKARREQLAELCKQALPRTMRS